MALASLAAQLEVGAGSASSGLFPEVAEGACAAAVGRGSGAGELAVEVEGAAASGAPRGKRKAADVRGDSRAVHGT